MLRGGGAQGAAFTAENQERAERVLALLRKVDGLLLEAAELVGALDASGYPEATGSATTIDWIRHEGKVSFALAAGLDSVGEQMHRLPIAVAAVEEGEIGFGHLVHLARLRREVGDHWLDEERLVEEAENASVSRFWHICQQARHAADPDGFAQEKRDLFEERRLRVSKQQDGMVTISGILDPVGGAAVKAALEPLARKSGANDDRSREERMADALVAVVRKQTVSHVHVTATVGTLLHVPQSAPAELGGHLLPAESLRRMTCDCSLSRMLFEGDSIVVDVGRERRVVSEQQRRPLAVRDRHCRFPGCERPAAWCEAHHVIHWSVGGATNLDNLVLLCSYHHFLVHEGGWQLLLHEDGHLEALRPPLDFRAPPRRAA